MEVTSRRVTRAAGRPRVDGGRRCTFLELHSTASSGSHSVTGGDVEEEQGLADEAGDSLSAHLRGSQGRLGEMYGGHSCTAITRQGTTRHRSSSRSRPQRLALLAEPPLEQLQLDDRQGTDTLAPPALRPCATTRFDAHDVERDLEDRRLEEGEPGERGDRVEAGVDEVRGERLEGWVKADEEGADVEDGRDEG